MLLEAMFRGEFYPAETVIPRDPAYRVLQKASAVSCVFRT